MIFRRFYDDQLAQASYLIGCTAAGSAVVIDPSRLIEPYLAAARAEGLRITAVTETHIHADFLSGLRELAARTGAAKYLSGCGPAEWQYGFRDEPGVVLLGDRSRIVIGNVALEAVHTPGHTPEHLSFLVSDGAVTPEPMGILTGDFVFVGDVGRPDLLEKAARVANSAAAGAATLFRSLQWFQTLPDHLQVWPGHGAGSACGKGLSAVPQSTVGYERRFNWAFAAGSEAEFVAQVLAGQPDPPKYFARMKRVNRDGPPILGRLPEPPRIDDGELPRLLSKGAVVVDTRSTGEFAGGHVPGTINIPFSRSFVSYAGSVLPYDRDLYFLLADGHPDTLARLVGGLVSIGLDQAAGWLDVSALAQWTESGRSLGVVPQVTTAELARRGGNGALLVDVRNTSEWDDGHLPGAALIPLPELTDRLDEVPADRDVIVLCQSGSRSSIAASVLRAAGRDRVSNLAGGFSSWVAGGGPIVR